MTKKLKKTKVSTTIIMIILLAFTGVIFAQKTDFDTRLSQKEIEVMKSIITTSVSLAKKGMKDNETNDRRFGRYAAFERFSEGGINGYYLYGQGVVFTIPYPCLAGKSSLEWEEAAARLEDLGADGAVNAEYLASQMAHLESQIEFERQSLQTWSLREEEFAPPAPPEPPDPAEAPRATGSRERDIEAREKAIAERVSRLKDKLNESREKSEEQRKQAEEERSIIREELIRVIATHGDSMTHVKDNEYINLILRDNCEPFVWDQSTGGQTVLSIKKSDLLAYRSGQQTLEQLKSKFVEYEF